MKVFVKGLHGCGMRNTNIQQYEDFLAANGHILVSHPRDSDVTLLWTCAFRGDFRDNSLAEIDRYMREYPCQLIVVGCFPDIDRTLLEKTFPGRFINWRNDGKQLEEFFGAHRRLQEIPRKLGDAALTDNLEQYKKDHPGKNVTFIDQFNKLYIAEGCRFKCTYCSEILAFPPYRSFPLDDLVRECQRLVRVSGRHEVILLGDSIGDYGCDIGLTLPQLIRSMCLKDPALRIALQGLNPASFHKYFDEMAAFIDQGRFRHVQLPLQSGSARVLHLMKRPYTLEQVEKIFAFLNQKKFTEFDTHIIVGFPGETEEDLEATIRFILRYRPKYVLANRYMESPEMPSSKLPDKVHPETALARLRKAAMRIQEAGILCNYDEGELSQARFHTLNNIP